jgi:hypothetical protein
MKITPYRTLSFPQWCRTLSLTLQQYRQLHQFIYLSSIITTYQNIFQKYKTNSDRNRDQSDLARTVSLVDSKELHALYAFCDNLLSGTNSAHHIQ